MILIPVLSKELGRFGLEFVFYEMLGVYLDLVSGDWELGTDEASP